MRRHTFALSILIVSLATLIGAIAPRAALAQTGQRCFAETGFCIEGRIREFWERNGGLPVFGLPIGPQGEEQIEGRPLQVQWFERNRLELHPENQRPYDVQIGRLGADRLEQQERDWFSFPKSEPREGCRFFAETGHNVCGAILAAWRAKGLDLDGRRGVSEAESLALFGLPLSDEQDEILADGKSYTVQWFERARVEIHPENQAPYNVLLGLLGTELRGIAPRPPEPPPAPQPADKAILNTAAGPLRIDGVELSDRFPPGCNPNSFTCDRAAPGYQILIVWLAPADGRAPGDVRNLFDASRDVYISWDANSREKRYTGGLLSGRLVMAFTPPAGLRTFTLVWPGNQPIAIEP